MQTEGKPKANPMQILRQKSRKQKSMSCRFLHACICGERESQNFTGACGCREHARTHASQVQQAYSHSHAHAQSHAQALTWTWTCARALTCMNAWTHGVLHFTKVCTCSLSVVQSRQHCDTPILVVGFVAQLARPLEALGCVPDRCRQDHWRPWVVRLTVVAMQGRRWEEEVWNVVRPAYERLRQLPAAGQTAERRDAYNKITEDQLKNSGESRHRLFNLSLS